VSQALNRVREVARRRKKERFIALLHHISVDLLRQAFYELKRDAAPGVDGLRWEDYEAGLERRLGDLHERVRRGAYRALPSRRRYIPKPDGRQRPLAVAALEDKIVQRATVIVLNAIYKEDFLGLSCEPSGPPSVVSHLVVWHPYGNARKVWGVTKITMPDFDSINAAFDMVPLAPNHLQIVAPGQQAQTPAAIELREDMFALCL
jgi:hypothetical protein